MESEKILEYAAAIRMTIAQLTTDIAPIVRFDDSEAAKKAASSKQSIKGLEPILYLDNPKSAADIVIAITDASHKAARHVKAIALANEGIFAVGQSGKDSLAVLAAITQNSAYAEPTDDDLRFGRLESTVTIVTGSAQGYGKGIAEELAFEGASIVVADLNDAAGTAFAEELNSHYGEGSAIYCHADVTSRDSVNNLVLQTVKAFGGLDMFVANAGVLKAGSVTEMDEKAFDFVTSVNYKAYFLCTAAAATIMKLQHTYNPEHFMDIVQINSKSGLQGSNKNFAYAGSKFGTIGLTQSFAMELVEFNIKVNSICPGNYYEGPLWSDPKTGLFVQYLNAGKIAGAKTIEDVKQSYMSKVPMKRGCSPLDVARAIFYVHEQVYETGQAIPVTGGQVMLN